MILKILKAGSGDCMLLRFDGNDGKPKNILIDGGRDQNEFDKHILPEIEALVSKGECLDLIIGTHIDQDHIKGLEYLFRHIKKNTSIKRKHIKEIWLNSLYEDAHYVLDSPIDIRYKEAKALHTSDGAIDISYEEANALEKHLIEFGDNWKKKIVQGNKTFWGAKITILSPTDSVLQSYRANKPVAKPVDISASTNDHKTSLYDLILSLSSTETEKLDNSKTNQSSIAFLFEHAGKSILFLGDANPKDLEDAIKGLPADIPLPLEPSYVKLSHHGSIKSISKGFLDLIKTNRYIISTNGNYDMPSKATLAKILSHPQRTKDDKKIFYFNYPNFIERFNFLNFEKEEYRFDCLTANCSNGYKIDLLHIDNQ